MEKYLLGLLGGLTVYFVFAGVFIFAYLVGYNKRKGELEAEKDNESSMSKMQ